MADELSLPVSTVARWREKMPTDDRPPRPCFRCESGEIRGDIGASYAYLLGQYLGDGHLVTSTRVPVLRIYSCADYPAVTAQVRDAIEAVRASPSGIVMRRSCVRLWTVQSYWMHWPCLLPQHGAGRKHERPIVLADWQEAIVDEHPWPLIRGLIHSDGCRAINTVRVGGRTYSYPRYLFSNESRDIQSIFTAALDRVGVP